MGRPQTGSVDRLSSGRWRARFQGPDGHRHTAIFESKGDAQAWLAAQVTDRRRGSWFDPRLGRLTVAEWAETWRETTIHLRPSTRAGYDSKLNTHVLPRLGRTPVSELDRPAIRKFLAELAASGMSPANIRGVRAVLRIVLGTAVEGGALPANPCFGIKLPRTISSEMCFLTAEEVEELAAAITYPNIKPAGNGAQPNWRTELPEYGLLVRFAAYTGLRAGEIAGLKVGKLNLMRSYVEVSETATEVNGELS